jgi:soluble lytic murein transglycosylase
MANRWITCVLLGCGLISSVGRASDLPAYDNQLLEQQRSVFRTIYPDVERGNWQAASQYEELLRDYVLWPDLRAAYLRTRLDKVDTSEVQEYLDEHGTLKPARELRYRYVLQLARDEKLAEYLAIYQQFYQGLEIAKLDCIALHAELDAGREKRVVTRAMDLWLVGRSQAEECEPVFESLRERNLLGSKQYADRFILAVAEKQFSLARYLSRSLDEDYFQQANDWLSAQNKPLDFLASHKDPDDSKLGRDQLTYAIGKLALADPILAQQQWQDISAKYAFTTRQKNEVDQHIALWAARDHLPEARQMLTALPVGAINTEVGRWLARTGLRNQEWAEVIDNIDALPADEKQKEEWQYWKAIALQSDGQTGLAREILADLANERSYYGFLAADVIGSDYAFSDSPLDDDDALVAQLAAMPALIRARELFLVGLDGRGRSEWDAAVRNLGRDEKAQAAILAHRWGWHSRAISTVANAGEFDDLSIRYPLPWRTDFEQSSKVAGISHSWAYGIARSESLFMRDVRSSAGAIGVMQLMPATGRQTAREIQFPYAGRTTLTDSSSNIRLGTTYLGKMYERFDENRVLATAAYNAGPHRVKAWLPDSGYLDARVWIENIPFRETRKYVRRVLTDEAIFHWRLTGRLRRISSELPRIDPQADLTQVASSH